MGVRNVVFFGDGPLLGPGLLDLVRHARAVDFSATLLTNGRLSRERSISVPAEHQAPMKISLDEATANNRCLERHMPEALSNDSTLVRAAKDDDDRVAAGKRYRSLRSASTPV